jgi:glycerol uptake facilitator-like aquaporin
MNMATHPPAFWRDRLQASAVHLAISAAIAALAAALVFWLWYPYPYREISGGRELFLIVVSVDVILGPFITLAVFNRTKPWTVLRRDLVVVAILQLLALGLWAVDGRCGAPGAPGL